MENFPEFMFAFVITQRGVANTNVMRNEVERQI